MLDALDCPDPSATAPARAVTSTPVQALALMNNATMLRAADGFARRVEHEAPDVEGRIVRAYRLAYGRAATAEEIAAARPAVVAHGMSVLTRAILNSNELLFIE